jgi:hypothetical protein
MFHRDILAYLRPHITPLQAAGLCLLGLFLVVRGPTLEPDVEVHRPSSLSRVSALLTQ